MIYKIETEQMNNIAPLFGNWQESLIWSCLQGCMGEAWADSMQRPEAARILLADFCFFAGQPGTGETGNQKPGQGICNHGAPSG